ncbi:MAG TPA: hypothetical protein PK771_06860 [Spirochaetota bacterium]|nr:hypothetical protein [Spirochaetota bacterium]
MKTLTLKINDSIYDDFIGSINKFKSDIKIVECNKYGIPYVSKKEQRIIEKELKNKDCFVNSSSEKIEVEI